MVIRTMFIGLPIIVCPWKGEIIISVNKSPIIVILLNLGINVFSKYSRLRFFVIITLEIHPAASGITTNNTTDKNNVIQGTDISLIPKESATIGPNPINIIRSFVATCTKVYARFPLVRWLQTRTIAVHGAAPSKTAPAR